MGVVAAFGWVIWCASLIVALLFVTCFTRAGDSSPRAILLVVLLLCGNAVTLVSDWSHYHLLWWYVAVTGLVLEGSIVRLESGEIGVVIEQSPSGEMARPIIQLLDGTQIDLSMQSDKGIASVIPLEGSGLNTVRCFGVAPSPAK